MAFTRNWNFIGLLACFLVPALAFGWDTHQSLMPEILMSLRPQIDFKAKSACAEDDSAMVQALIKDFHLNAKTQVPPTVSQGCEKEPEISIYQILAGSSVDDPDLGMDQELPRDPSYDPNDDRKWMGGYEGLKSQGFRHMYFGGWKLAHPIETFQVPIHAEGQAPYRAELIAEKGKSLLKEGQTAWGFRLIAWSMHYIQDLTQPFHSVQVINLNLADWKQLLQWPPQKGLADLVQETTRIVSNYHLAYETYIFHQIRKGEQSPFKECLSSPEKFTNLKMNPSSQELNPLNIALGVTDASIENASKLGPVLFDFFGKGLLSKEINLADNKGTVPYDELGTRPELEEPRQKLHQLTCVTLANASLASRRLIEWALKP